MKHETNRNMTMVGSLALAIAGGALLSQGTVQAAMYAPGPNYTCKGSVYFEEQECDGNNDGDEDDQGIDFRAEDCRRSPLDPYRTDCRVVSDVPGTPGGGSTSHELICYQLMSGILNCESAYSVWTPIPPLLPGWDGGPGGEPIEY